MCFITQNWPQCEDCGAVSTTIPDSRTTCGGCYQNRKKNAGNQPDSQDSIEEKARQAQQLKEDERRNGMSARGLIGANRKISAAPRAGAANNAVRLITTYLCSIGEKGSNPKSRLGVSHKDFPETTSLNDAVDDLLKQINTTWDRSCSHSLTSNFLTLKFHNGQNFILNSDKGTLGELLSINESQLPADLTKRCPGTYKPRAPFIWLEAIIMVEEFEQYFECEVPHFVLNNVEINRRKRNAQKAGLGNANGSKISRLKLASSANARRLTSSFTPAGYSEIKLAIAEVRISKTGVVSVTWPDLNDEGITIEDASISDVEFAHGKSQRVYSLKFRGGNWAAKRYYNIGDGPEEFIDIEKNKLELEREGIRLSQTFYFLKHFGTHAESNEVDIGDDLTVAEFLLALEVVEVHGHASRASGVNQDAFLDRMPAEHGGDDASSLDKNIWSVAWLLEKMRAKQSSKWSGTNAHPTYTNNKLGNVLNAFAHFVYQYSQNTIVIADIQSK
ncbi:hypothetical protein K435DRAFT_874373 [Dendrothele bispora CBS 962.96]|uniref:Alpha-type protein kinase domain-containing protein n=1 Tax=Dendrothele bispora (strain CBS 962.96) TaxID=1314807 RepID=A0A4V4HBS2_DENBC|nr:hypothetical protein K435DRAFT_874373 [Dendrothele bispora CBS 962.96]